MLFLLSLRVHNSQTLTVGEIDDAHSPNKGKETKNRKKKKWELMKKRTNKQDYSSRSGIHGFPARLCPSVGVGGHISDGGFGNSPIT